MKKRNLKGLFFVASFFLLVFGFVNYWQEPVSALSPWTQLGADIDGEAAGDYSGWAVAMSADSTRVAIGAPDIGAGSGYVRVYDWNGTAWTQLGADIDGEASCD